MANRHDRRFKAEPELRRNEQIQIRLTTEERRKLEARADAEQITVSSLIRRSLGFEA